MGGLAEPDVALTDFGLALECGLFAYWLAARGGEMNTLRCWFVSFFAASAASALLGGLTHGFFPSVSTPAGIALWRGTLVAIGLVAWSGWAIGGRLLLSPAAARWLERVSGLAAVAYVAAVLSWWDDFRVAVLYYLPAAAFLLVAFSRYRAQRPTNAGTTGALGMVLTFAAAGIQQGQVSIHPTYFNYNALYHVVQAFAFLLLFVAARGICGDRSK